MHLMLSLLLVLSCTVVPSNLIPSPLSRRWLSALRRRYCLLGRHLADLLQVHLIGILFVM